MNQTDGAKRLPLLLIAYSRDAGVKNLLNSINPLDISEIYLTLDGAKSVDVALTQEEIVRTVSSYCLANSIPFHTWLREDNLGVAVSIISSIDWFFKHVNSGVIAEDDLLLGNSFFDFMRMGLDFIDKNPDVLLVSGDCFLEESSSNFKAYLTNYPLIWGWGTTSFNWIKIREGILSSRKCDTSFSLNKRLNFWKVGAARVHRGQIDTWDIPFVDFMLSQNKFCLFPSVNLVTNNGYDSYATHTFGEEFPLNLPVHEWNSSSRINLEPLYELCEEVNSQLDRRVFKIRIRHSILGIIFIIRKFFGLESPKLQPLLNRIRMVSIPEPK